MSNTLEKATKKFGKLGLDLATSQTSFQKRAKKKIHQGVEKPFRKGTSAAARDARNLAAKQQQMETARLAEVEGEVARRRSGALSTRSGRRSLISSAGGLATNLGGTSA